MNTKVICVSGKAGSGKDTFGEILRLELADIGKKSIVVHYADLVKFICAKYFDWNGEKDKYGRSLLQKVGTDIVRAKDEDFWVKFVATMLEFFDGEWDYVIIPDCRFPNELTYLKKRGFNVLHAGIDRGEFISALTEEQKNHPSETSMDSVKPDVTIANKGTLNDLMNETAMFVKEVLHENNE